MSQISPQKYLERGKKMNTSGNDWAPATIRSKSDILG
jgi:hypothetical protein